MASEKNASVPASPTGSDTSHKSNDLESVSASESKLVSDDSKSLVFGKSLMDKEELNSMVKKRIF